MRTFLFITICGVSLLLCACPHENEDSSGTPLSPTAAPVPMRKTQVIQNLQIQPAANTPPAAGTTGDLTVRLTPGTLVVTADAPGMKFRVADQTGETPATMQVQAGDYEFKTFYSPQDKEPTFCGRLAVRGGLTTTCAITHTNDGGVQCFCQGPK